MKWIKPVTFACLLLVAIAFLIFGAPPPPPSVAPDTTVVEYWEKWVGTEGAQMQEIVNDFNRTTGRDKHIFVRYLSMTDVDQKTLVSLAGGVPPDIAGLWDQQVAQFAALEAVEPLDDLAAAHGITAQTYLPVFWNSCHYNGRLYGLVSTGGTVAMIYNKRIFHDAAPRLKAAGLDPTRPPRTIEELDKYNQALEVRDDEGHLERAGFLPLQSWYVPLLSFWFGGNIFDPATQRFTIDSPPTIAAYRWIAAYANRVGPRAMMDFQESLGSYDSPQNPFMAGRLAMQQQGAWMANKIIHLQPSMSQLLVPTDQESTLPNRQDNYEWSVAPFPSVAGLHDVSYNSFDVLVIPRGARHKNAAFEFLAYVTSQPVAEKLNTLHSTNCQLRFVSDDFLNHHPNPYIRIFQKLAASPNAHGVPPVPIWPEVSKELIDAAQSVVLEGVDPVIALHKAQDRMQEKYDRFRRIEEQREHLNSNPLFSGPARGASPRPSTHAKEAPHDS